MTEAQKKLARELTELLISDIVNSPVKLYSVRWLVGEDKNNRIYNYPQDVRIRPKQDKIDG